MNAALIKVDVVAARMGRTANWVLSLVDGGTLVEAGWLWVWNLAHNPVGERRDLRWWSLEVDARAAAAKAHYAGFAPETVIDVILPPTRTYFHAGEVDALFQIRPRTRIDLHGELAGSLKSGHHQYHRSDLAKFLQRRWLGAACQLTTSQH